MIVSIENVVCGSQFLEDIASLVKDGLSLKVKDELPMCPDELQLEQDEQEMRELFRYIVGCSCYMARWCKLGNV